MTSSKLPLLGSEKIIRSWIKGCLSSWFENKSSIAFEPYEEYFRLRQEPHQILYNIYRALPTTRSRPFLSPAARFRKALANLISEPEIYRRNPQVYLEILRLSESMGCDEVLDAVASIFRNQAIPRYFSEEEGQGAEIDLLNETVSTVLRAGFHGKNLVQFLKSTFPYIKGQQLRPINIMLAISKNDPENWAKYAIELREELSSYFIRKDTFDLNTLGQENFRQRLQASITRDDLQNGLFYLQKNGHLTDLHWLIPREFGDEMWTDQGNYPFNLRPSLGKEVQEAYSEASQKPLADLMAVSSYGQAA